MLPKIILSSVGILLLWSRPATAQFIFGPGAAFYNRGGVALDYHTRRFHLVASLGGFSSGGFFPFGPAGFGSYYTSNFTGPSLFPFFGGNPIFSPFGYSYAQTQVIVTPPPVIIQQNFFPQNPEPVDLEPRVANPERFIIVRPDAKPRQQVAPAPPKKVAVPAAPKKVELGIRPALFPLAPERDKNPQLLGDQLIVDGRGAFLRKEYGRAFDLFRTATETAPQNPWAWFLLFQAEFAIAKYDDAASTLVRLMKLKPDWSKTAFNCRDLYPQGKGNFDRHLDDVREALALQPDDPRLLFVLGVQLWFDNKKLQARKLLERARLKAADPSPIRDFLKD